MLTIKNYIGGTLEEPISGEYFDNINPALGRVYSQVPDSTTKDVEKAVSAAKEAFPEWSTTPVRVRADYLLKLSRAIEKNIERLAEAESIDNGKPLKLARAIDIPRAAKNFHFFSTAIQHFSSEFYQTDQEAINYTLRKPLGPVACISPWNLPLYLFSWKVAPALAAGNTVVGKPSEITPMTAYILSELCMEVGFPPGVFNIIHGKGARCGEALVTHADIEAVSFTGGTATGRRIASLIAPEFKKMSLELGGKNPNIVFADCDFKDAVKNSVKASFANQGEICLCGSRIFVEKPIYQKFKEAFLQETKKLKIGDPLDPSTNLGALVSEVHKNKVLGYIALAKEEGGTILYGGKEEKPDGNHQNGYFVQPTVIENLDAYCRTNQEEIFGPVVTLTPFESEEEVIEWANSTPYGLSATLWTESLSKAHNTAAKLNCGIVWINCWLLRDLRTPFGGTKQSGVGREGGFEALEFFTETQNICIKT